jgi:nucleoside 2-deoxyribosyltransferase
VPDRDVWGFRRQAIFSLDVYQVLSGCDGVVVNLNGEMPDDGAVVEMTLAASCGKPLVAFMDDEDGNPMVTGLVSFRLVHSLRELPQAMREAFAQQHLIKTNLPPILSAAVEMGRRIAPALKAGGADKAAALAPIFEAWRAQQGSAPERSARSPDRKDQGGGCRH